MRSLRKQYAIPTQSRRIHNAPSECAKIYGLYLDQATELFGAQIDRLNLRVKDIAICMGAFSASKILKRHFEDEPEVVARVQEVYDYLYKFSFERLQVFVQDPVMVMLFYYMMEVQASFPENQSCPLTSLADN